MNGCINPLRGKYALSPTSSDELIHAKGKQDRVRIARTRQIGTLLIVMIN